MLYVATVHYRSPRWIEIQARYLKAHISVPFQTWSSLEGIDPAYGVHFDRVVEQLGPHAGKLNHLAMEISQEAADEDLLMFLDGDAFPIVDPMPVIEQSLARAPLLAVRRAENLDEPQPHPCFCVTTVGTWRSLPGDWSAGPTWIGPKGRPRTDVGGSLLRRLELTKTPWVDLLRSNRHDLDPIFFAIYGDLVYHHGSGFRKGGPSGIHRTVDGPSTLRVPDVPVIGRLVGAINRRRWQSWEEATQERRLAQSQTIYDKIKAGDESWLEQLR
ncbi:MAG TPA: hypothetical protein VKG82_01125 [Solirubrobacteraceae bacterium]|nr:hypothetical protein [Solirubrobacteraceae bacterium]